MRTLEIRIGFSMIPIKKKASLIFFNTYVCFLFKNNVPFGMSLARHAVLDVD